MVWSASASVGVSTCHALTSASGAVNRRLNVRASSEQSRTPSRTSVSSPVQCASFGPAARTTGETRCAGRNRGAFRASTTDLNRGFPRCSSASTLVAPISDGVTVASRGSSKRTISPTSDARRSRAVSTPTGLSPRTATHARRTSAPPASPSASSSAAKSRPRASVSTCRSCGSRASDAMREEKCERFSRPPRSCGFIFGVRDRKSFENVSSRHKEGRRRTERTETRVRANEPDARVRRRREQPPTREDPGRRRASVRRVPPLHSPELVALSGLRFTLALASPRRVSRPTGARAPCATRHGTRARAPEPSPATQPAPKQTTFRRLVLVNQELAQHNTKVRLASFPPAARGPRSRARPTLTTTLLSCPQLRQDLADARRRAAVAANAEAQAGIVVAMHRERQAEAASLRRELLVRERPALGLYGIGFGREANLEGRSSRVRKKKPSSDDASPLLARLFARPQTSLSDAREEIRKLKIQVDAQASLLRLQRALDTSPANRSTNRDASPAASTTRREPEGRPSKKTPSKPPSPEPWSPVRGVSNTLGLVPPISCFESAREKTKASKARDTDACVSQSREDEKTEVSTMPPPASARPRVNLRGFAARARRRRRRREE